ncbi:MAG TPA: hypothetical protein VLR50_19695, partial [Desulfobacterales bacterium]|nr:hypothetical protein [Desulfobacterales bacterium]
MELLTYEKYAALPKAPGALADGLMFALKRPATPHSAGFARLELGLFPKSSLKIITVFEIISSVCGARGAAAYAALLASSWMPETISAKEAP